MLRCRGEEAKGCGIRFQPKLAECVFGPLEAYEKGAVGFGEIREHKSGGRSGEGPSVDSGFLCIRKSGTFVWKPGGHFSRQNPTGGP